MRIALSLVLLAALLVVALLAYVRLATSDPESWHISVEGEGDADFSTGARRVMNTGADGLAAVDAYMRRLPRTTVLAGSVAEGRITYVTRSKVFAFPDYTTVEQHGSETRAVARARFGHSDHGVNRERLEGLVAALQ